ncbi:MAG: hypothetical protein RSF75_00020 [Acidaminococcaceae bacterium]
MTKVQELSVFLEHLLQQEALPIALGKLQLLAASWGEVTLGLHWQGREPLPTAVLSVLISSVLVVTAASVGAQVTPLNCGINFTQIPAIGSEFRVQSTLKHRGRSTLVLDSRLVRADGQIVATSLATLFVIGHFDEFPEKW